MLETISGIFVGGCFAWSGSSFADRTRNVIKEGLMGNKYSSEREADFISSGISALISYALGLIGYEWGKSLVRTAKELYNAK